MIRLIILILFLIFFFLLSIPVYLIEWIIGKINMNVRHKSSRCIVAGAFRICLFISGVKIEAKGLENIPPDKACLFVGNHNGFFDILVSYVQIHKVMGFVAKKEMIKVPFLRIWMYFINCLFLDRNDIKAGLKTILKGVEQIKDGISIFVFPEGTRSKDGKMRPFKEGSLKMGEKSNCPIIPVAFQGTSAIFEDHFPKLRKGKVIIQFGEPIIASELEKEDKKFLGAYVQGKIQNMLDKQI